MNGGGQGWGKEAWGEGAVLCSVVDLLGEWGELGFAQMSGERWQRGTRACAHCKEHRRNLGSTLKVMWNLQSVLSKGMAWYFQAATWECWLFPRGEML